MDDHSRSPHVIFGQSAWKEEISIQRNDFSEDGPGFRASVVLCGAPGVVDSRGVNCTGGGAVVWPANRTLLAQNGTVIYLHASVRQQVARTGQSQHRPLLNTGEAPSAILSRLFEQRDPLYRQIADVVIETQGRSARLLVDEIQAHLAQRDP